MVVITTTAVPAHVRGALSRWMVEPSTGVYVGTMSARVRDELWAAVSASVGDGAAVCLCPADNEQGFDVRTAGERRREVVDWEGMMLVQMNPLASAEVEMERQVPEGW
ncbi:type I-E CRISPR-associated endoribonuclease Cas2e [Streptomonospora salina]|uniref:CRISPR-associated protein Cas2 n=1 Tax=Streptomonospora salina TaxID=104205 RepID=A0A841EKX5_9ACTN|nr:type I-E CRISPR-associated endoribonuclease Cas2e [Streptomonospora salina]MBB6000061.1 CRISPR-associated protein Cas2 [Streptomonospora salina]